MNKTVNVNLGGYPFILNEDAYFFLEDYLNSLKDHFAYSEGSEEIVEDIETRMAELLTEQLKGKNIATKGIIETVISIMGYPEDFEDATYESYQEEPMVRTGKRLFRDPENKIIGGVCSGLATYLGIKDPVWVRLAFALLVLSGGIGLLPYIILWLVLPEARTSADRLAMEGEPINVSNIAKAVEGELSHLKKAITDFGQELKSKKKDKK